MGDGRLLVAGGHKKDSAGLPHTSIFDPATSTWTAGELLPGPAFEAGRWYPTLLTLGDGSVLASGGTNELGTMMKEQVVWKDGRWRTIVRHDTITMYPRLHLATDGRAFLAGPLATTQWLETTDRGNWTVVGNRRSNQFYEYAPTVMYIPGKVIYIGGGDPPVKTCEKIDLTQGEPAWELTDPMAFARRHHNATILPDGTVLVTGGTQGDGFNNLTVGKPIRAAEVWNPVTGKWATLAEESVDRCYHSAAVLLPDGRVLSTGGGEYRPNGVDPNPPEDSHRDAQIFSPPYLFRGARPVIVAAPAVVEFGKPIEITTPDAAAVARVTLVRLSSATHSCNMNQRFNELMFVMAAGKVTATAPDKPNSCPPGHYLLTILNTAGVPSVSKILRIK